jgi:malic enzyme
MNGLRPARINTEGKAILFQTFAGIEAYPICLATQDVDEIITAVEHIVPAFGGINLEDISALHRFSSNSVGEECYLMPFRMPVQVGNGRKN